MYIYSYHRGCTEECSPSILKNSERNGNIDLGNIWSGGIKQGRK